MTTEKLRLDIPIILPTAPHEADGCVARLIGELSPKEGIEDVHVVPATESVGAQLCVHFNDDVISLQRIRELVQGIGARITDRFGHLSWTVSGITNERRARTITERLRRTAGVLESGADAAGALRIEYDRTLTSEADIRRLLGTMGVSPMEGEAPVAVVPERTEHDHEDHAHAHDSEEEGHVHAHGGFFGQNTELIFALLCGALLAVGFGLEKAAVAEEWVSLAFYCAAYVFGGFFTVREAIDNIRLRRFEIDTLMLVAAAGAGALGAWAEGALLLFLFSIGHALEHYAMGKAKRAIEALAKLAPPVASVRRGSAVVEVPVEELAVGDTILVKPDERIAADGFVVVGSTSVNQAPVTGESIPVDKRPVSDRAVAATAPDQLESMYRVFAGTINGSGAIEVAVTRRSTESALARVVKLVSEAETQKSPTQRFTDKFERVFVPAVLVLVVLLMCAGLVIDEPFRDSFYRAMAVLVAASPCALAIATPSAVLSGVARAARGGVLVKGGGALENLGALTAIAFDKTGTLTEGRPRITDVEVTSGNDEATLLKIAVGVERMSDHPLARAVTRDGLDRLGKQAPATATDVVSFTGKGVSAQIDGKPAYVGKAEMYGQDGLAPLSGEAQDHVAMLREQGRTTMVIRLGNTDLGVIGLMDTPRASAKAALAKLRSLGIRRMIMISGDHQKVADSIAREVGIEEAWGGLMPEGKVDAIRKLRESTKIAMVGDGVNDAPAMANATVGIAMGAAGSDVALETADVALMADDLAHLPFAVGLSRSTRAIIRQNLFISLGVVSLLVPATILGLSIGVAVSAHEGSTLVVVFNALRLLAYRDR